MSVKKSESNDSHQHSPSNVDGSTHFILSGVFWIGAHRLVSSLKGQTFTLNCKRLWREDELSLNVSTKSVNFLEFFTVKSDNNFLDKVENKNLCINLTCINNSKQIAVGTLRMPLHQFFIAYRDVTLANRLSNAELPVFSTDSWVPIFDQKNEKLGEVECMLAIGTEKQIDNIKKSKGWESEKLTTTNNCIIDVLSHNFKADSDFRKNGKVSNNKTNIHNNLSVNVDKDATCSEAENILNCVPEILQSIYSNSPYSAVVRGSGEENENMKPLRINLVIIMARDLPTATKHIGKPISANREKNVPSLRDEEPITYVTFQANISKGIMVKSHEGMVATTSIVEKSSNPTWNELFQFTTNSDYLTNKNKRFILKVWRKSSSSSAAKSMPSPLEDKIIGFVALDLTILQNKSQMYEWFNIMNSFGHVNGQLKLSVQCVNELHPVTNDHDNKVDNLLNSFEADLSINNFNLSRAIKRKFTELEEISQRLRARLLDVANSTDYINELESTDEYTKEFELDLNTVVSEEDCEVDYFNNKSEVIRNLQNPNP